MFRGNLTKTQRDIRESVGATKKFPKRKFFVRAFGSDISCNDEAGVVLVHNGVDYCIRLLTLLHLPGNPTNIALACTAVVLHIEGELD
jgi:hypothetical protein